MPKPKLSPAQLQKEKENNEPLHEVYPPILRRFSSQFNGNVFFNILEQAQLDQSEKEKWKRSFKVELKENQSQYIDELIARLAVNLEAKNDQLNQLEYDKARLETRVGEIDQLEAKLVENEQQLALFREKWIEEAELNKQLFRQLSQDKSSFKILENEYEKQAVKLEDEKDELYQNLKTKDNKLNGLEKKISGLEIENQAILTEFEANQVELEELSKELKKNKSELKESKEEIAWFREQVKAKDKALNKVHAKETKLFRQLKAENQELRQLRIDQIKFDIQKEYINELQGLFAHNEEWLGLLQRPFNDQTLELGQAHKEQLDEKEMLFQKLEAVVVGLWTRKDAISQELEALKNKNTQMKIQYQEKLTELENQNKELDNKLMAERDEFSRQLRIQELKAKQVQLEEAKGKDQLEQKLQVSERKKKSITQELEELKAKQVELETLHQGEVNQLNDKSAQLKIRYQEKVTELEDQIRTSEEVVDALKKGNIKLSKQLDVQDAEVNGRIDENKKIIANEFYKRLEELEKKYQKGVAKLEEERDQLRNEHAQLKTKKVIFLDQTTQFPSADDPIESAYSNISGVSISTPQTTSNKSLENPDFNTSSAAQISNSAETTQPQPLNIKLEWNKNTISLLLFQLEALSGALTQAPKEIPAADVNRSDLLKYIQFLQQVAKSTSNQEESAEERSSDQGEENSQGLMMAQLAKLSKTVEEAAGETDEGNQEEKQFQLQSQIKIWMKWLAQQIVESKTILEGALKPEAGNEQKKQALKLQEALSNHLNHLLPFSWLVQSWNNMENKVRPLRNKVNQSENQDTSLGSIYQKINDKNYLLFLRALSQHPGWKKELEPIVFHKEGLAEYISKLEGDRSNPDHSSSNPLLKEWIQINRNAIGFAAFFKAQAPYVDQSWSEKKIESGSDYQTVVKRAYENGRCCLDSEANNENGILSLSADPKPFTDFARRPEPDFYTTHIFNMSQGGKFETVDGWVKNSSDQYTYTKTLTSLPNQVLEKRSKYQEIDVNDIKVKIPSSYLIELAIKMLLDFTSKVDTIERIHINHAEDPMLVEALWGVAQVLALGDRIVNNTRYPDPSRSKSNAKFWFGYFSPRSVDKDKLISCIRESIKQDSKLQERVDAFCMRDQWHKQGVDQILEQVFSSSGAPSKPQKNGELGDSHVINHDQHHTHFYRKIG